MPVVALALTLTTATALGDGEISFQQEAGVEFSGVVAQVAGNQCLQSAAGPSGTIEWGDGQSSPGDFVKTSLGVWNVEGKHTYSRPGAYGGNVTGSYKCGGSEAQFTAVGFSAEITGTAHIKAETGVEFSGIVVGTRATQCDLPKPSGTIEWGDGQTSAAEFSKGVHLDDLLVSGKHTYAKPGTYDGHFKGTYECPGGETPELEPAPFIAEVTGAEKPAPPASPPAVHASFGVQSVLPGKVVLDAAASTPAGASATTYSWNVTGGSQPDAVCQGSEPTLTLQTGAALNTNVSLTATDAATGAQTVVSQHLQIPAPTKPALIGKIARAAVTAPRVSLKGAVTPAFKVIGTCTGAGVPLPRGTPFQAAGGFKPSYIANLGGVPPSNCLEETEFGAADVEGCLSEVQKLEEIPGGITLGLSKLLCGSTLQQFCMPALSALAGTAVSTISGALDARAASSGPKAVSAANLSLAKSTVSKALGDMKFPFYYSTTAIRIDGLDLDPQNGSPIVVVPGADLVFGLNVKVYLHDIPLVSCRR